MPAKNVITGKPARLLQRVAKLILEEPLRYNQADWIRKTEHSPCGTAGCISGWIGVCSLSSRVTPKFIRSLDLQYDAAINGTSLDTLTREALGEEVFNLAYEAHLFTGGPEGEWPEPFSSRWGKIDRDGLYDGEGTLPVNVKKLKRVRRAEAKIAASRIAYFIRTGQ